ncbi:MAG: TolC family protein [Syntrophobacteraceae bacterium]
MRRKMGRFFVALGAALLVTGTVFVGGAACGDKHGVVSLDDAIGMALERSPELREADQDIASAKADLDQAKGGRWAQLDVVGVTGPVKDADLPIVRTNPVNFNNGGMVGKLVDQDHDSIGIFGRLELALVQPLFTFGKISNRIKAAAKGLEAQRAAKDRKRNELVRNVKEMYFGLLVAQQGRDAAKDAEDFNNDAKRRIERLLQLKAKNVDPNDLYRIESLDGEIQAFKAKAESGAKTAYMALKQTIGFPAGQDFALDVKELPKDTRALSSKEENVRMALDKRPEFEQLRHGIEAQKSMVKAARADLYPTVFAAGFGSFAGAPGRDRMDISYFPDEFNHAQGGAVLGGQWHFDFGITRAKVRKEEAGYKKLQASQDFAEQNIPVEVTKYYDQVIEYQASYQAYEKAAVAARKWIVTSFSNFDLGVGSARDMYDAIDRYGKNQGEYLLTLYSYHVSLANLSYAVGDATWARP